MQYKNLISIISATLLLCACAGSPPLPAQPDGNYRPINQNLSKRATAVASKQLFNFSYEGDISGALPALKKVYPNLQVKPSLGKAVQLPVRIHLQQATLERALRTIGEQGVNIADVVWNKHPNGRNEAFLRFRSATKK